MKSVALLAIMLVVGVTSTPAAAQTETLSRGAEVLPAADSDSTGEKWALIIGVNYSEREHLTASDRATLPALQNAVKDALDLEGVLKTYYGYRDDHVLVLTEDAATFEAIETALGNLRASVNRNDNVVVFFSGHGVRLRDSEDQVAILPYDVQLSNGTPTAKFIPLHGHLFDRLRSCPAKHKLVILDSCYSGEIFNVNFQPRSETDDRSDIRLQHDEAFQAIASCRATQVASDGADGNSPFAAALLDGLKRLPAHDDDDRRVWANRLLAYIRPRFIGSDQVPDCRSLTGPQGEFCFYPGKPSLFSEFRIRGSDQNLLRAMVASRQGNWWFHEMPWFIPSVREQIIRVFEETQESPRTSGLSELIDPIKIREAAEQASKQLSSATEDDKRRRAHFEALLETHRTDSFNDTLHHICTELQSLAEQESGPTRDASRESPGLSASAAAPSQALATDVHLLAIVQHALGKRVEAKASYEDALRRYRRAAAGDAERSSHRILEALCRADFGEFMLEQMGDADKAAENFREADKQIASLSDKAKQQAAAVFRVFILCREADAWLQLNRWSEANNRLDEALAYANQFASEHYLTAHVHRRRAWAHIIQWEIDKAECSFRRSNEILAVLLKRGVGAADPEFPVDAGMPTASVAAPNPGSPLDSPGTGQNCSAEHDPFTISDALRVSDDFASKLAYLHNLHGIAMARRFKGETQLAAEKYRWLVGEVEVTMFRLRDTKAHSEVEQQFIERLINTQERLGDCNLFGDPSVRDLKEAADDYRRAMSLVHQFRGMRREQWQALLLYKQALALSQPSPIQDTELALEMSRRADEIYARQQATATGLYLALGTLTTNIVSVLDWSAGPAARHQPMEDADPGAAAVARLRESIHIFRDAVGQSPHRDQLELCLFASRVLLEHAGGQNRYQTIDDTDLLLSFCRMALAPRRESIADRSGRTEIGSRAYLRPYYNAAMRGRLCASRKQVKELLEIHWEATRGSSYLKPPRMVPVLAVYVLDGEALMMVDLPEGESRCLSLAEHCDLAGLQKACAASERRLPLPLEIRKLLTEWKQEAACETACIECWLDRTSQRSTQVVIEADIVGNRRVLEEAPVHFPFELPAGFSVDPMASNEQTVAKD